MPETTRMEIMTAKPPQTRKEIKIRLTREMCLRLHERKIIDGVTIADTITTALEAYLASGQARGARRSIAVDAGDSADPAPEPVPHLRN